MHSFVVAAIASVIAFPATLMFQPTDSKAQPKAPAAAAAPATGAPRDDAAAEKLGFKLGVQAWTFRDRTAFETIEIAHKLGIKYIEFYPGQSLSPDAKEAKVGPDLTSAQRDALKKKLKDANIKAMNFGVCGFNTSEAEARKIFDFAKDMGLETITCEPEPDAWPLVDKLANEYKINAACHNHPKPSRYWNPDTVLESIKGRSNRCGACADTGHWPRSGLKSIDCLKKYEGHIICLHFKDISHDVDQPWGTGDSDAKGMMAELKRQNFHGVISIEYETGAGKELEDNAAKCIAFFDKTCKELLGSSK